MPTLKLEDLRVYRTSENIADEVWELVGGWDHFAKDTIGKQLVRAADSIGANIAEGYGRGSYADNRRFVKIARGSLYEIRHFLRRADRRKLLPADAAGRITELAAALAPSLNAYLRSIGPSDETTDQ